MKNDERAVPNARVRRDVGANDHAAHQDDPFRLGHRPPEPTRCPQCHASFVQGRWSWQKAPSDSYEQMCPACARIHERFPAGYVTIKGPFFAEHRDEIVALIGKYEKAEKAERPLLRIMAIDEKKEGVEITTTDAQLARGIGELLHETYKGDLKLRHSRDENLLRAAWKR